MSNPKEKPTMDLLDKAKRQPKQTGDLRAREASRINPEYYRAAELLLEKGWKIHRIAKWIAAEEELSKARAATVRWKLYDWRKKREKRKLERAKQRAARGSKA